MEYHFVQIALQDHYQTLALCDAICIGRKNPSSSFILSATSRIFADPALRSFAYGGMSPKNKKMDIFAHSHYLILETHAGTLDAVFKKCLSIAGFNLKAYFLMFSGCSFCQCGFVKMSR